MTSGPIEPERIGSSYCCPERLSVRVNVCLRSFLAFIILFSSLPDSAGYRNCGGLYNADIVSPAMTIRLWVHSSASEYVVYTA